VSTWPAPSCSDISLCSTTAFIASASSRIGPVTRPSGPAGPSSQSQVSSRLTSSRSPEATAASSSSLRRWVSASIRSGSGAPLTAGASRTSPATRSGWARAASRATWPPSSCRRARPARRPRGRAPRSGRPRHGREPGWQGCRRTLAGRRPPLSRVRRAGPRWCTSCGGHRSRRAAGQRAGRSPTTGRRTAVSHRPGPASAASPWRHPRPSPVPGRPGSRGPIGIEGDGMSAICIHSGISVHMSRVIQIRDVPDDARTTPPSRVGRDGPSECSADH